MEIAVIIEKPIVDITSFGIETCRYNSLIILRHERQEDLALYANGNRLVLYDLDSKRIVLDKKIINDAIMVLT